jgi:hypothetical protein
MQREIYGLNDAEIWAKWSRLQQQQLAGEELGSGAMRPRAGNPLEFAAGATDGKRVQSREPATFVEQLYTLTESYIAQQRRLAGGKSALAEWTALVVVAAFVGILQRSQLPDGYEKLPTIYVLVLTLFSLFVALPSVRTFAFDTSSFWRESAAGVSPTAFYCSRTLADLPSLSMRALVFGTVFWSASFYNGSLSLLVGILFNVMLCASGAPRRAPGRAEGEARQSARPRPDAHHAGGARRAALTRARAWPRACGRLPSHPRHPPPPFPIRAGLAYVIAITVPPSLAVTVCGVLICCLCGFFAGIVPTMAEAGPAMRFALELSYGRWATQCLASSDFLNIPNALYAEQGRMLVAMFAWPSPADLAKNGAGPCSKPFGVLITLGVVLRIVGCLAINFCHRGHQCKPPLCMPAFKAPRGRRPVVKNLQRSRVSRKPLLLGTAASRVASSAMV